MYKFRRIYKYTDNFKATAIALSYIRGVAATDVAEALDLHPVQIYRWRRDLKEGKIVSNKKNINIDPELKSELQRLRKLEREHNLLKQEHALLKKAIRFTSERRKISSSSSTVIETSTK